MTIALKINNLYVYITNRMLKKNILGKWVVTELYSGTDPSSGSHVLSLTVAVAVNHHKRETKHNSFDNSHEIKVG